MCYAIYDGSFAHFKTRATAVPCMQNMCTHVYMKDQEVLLQKIKRIELQKKLIIPITLYHMN